ncbi:MAG: NFACT family protein [Candidatus Diapherotrites archaeon]
MEIDNFCLRCLIKEIKETIQGAYVNKVSEIENGTIKLKLHTKKGSKDMILTKNVFYLTSFSYQARQGKSNFAESLKKNLYNKRILGLEQHGSDRVAKLLFLDYTLVLEFIGEGNKILLDKDNKIIACEKNEEWSDRITKKGETYKFPQLKSVSPINLTKNQLIEIFSKSEKDTIRTLISCINLSPVFAEEVLYRLKINKNKKAKEITEEESNQISTLINSLFNAEKEFFSPSLYQTFAYPIKLMSIAEEPKSMERFNDCIDEFFSKVAKQNKGVEKNIKIPKIEFLKKQQEEAKKKFLKAIEENTRKGEIIYSNLHEIEELRTEVLNLIKKGMKEEEILKEIHSKALQKPFFKNLKSVFLDKKKIEIEVEEK